MRGLFGAIVIAAAVSWPRAAMADAVDDAFRRGNEAAAAAQWNRAIEQYEQASRLLPEANGALAYNLGTAYAHADELGHATYHLRRALDPDAGATTEIAEAARFNLAIVRRRAELQATSTGAQIDRPQTWWDLVVDSLRSRFVAAMAVFAGWAFVVGFVLARVRARRGRRSSPAAWAVLVVLGGLYLIPGSLHALAMRAARTSPDAIVTVRRVEARDGPGTHRKISFALQGGSRVRLVERTPGWAHVRLPGGLAGWVPPDTVVRLDRRRDLRPTVLTTPALRESNTADALDSDEGR